MELESILYKIQIEYADNFTTTIICHITPEGDDYKFDGKLISQLYDFYVDKECGVDVIGFSAMPYKREEE